MSNEWKDLLLDRREYIWSQINGVNPGWDKTFIPKLVEELVDVLGPYTDDFDVIQVKEKYGELRIYWMWNDRDYTNYEIDDLNEIYNDIEDILDKYAEISINTCVTCGNKATHLSKGYILPYCDDCHKCDDLS